MEKTVLILHGPNLNLLGTRETEVYGELTLAEIDRLAAAYGEELGLAVRGEQSNHEGALIELLHDSRDWAHGVVFNPAGYTHTSVALRDAVAAIEIPVVEVHLSNIFAREAFRHTSLISPVAAGVVSGFGWRSYLLGLKAISELL